MALLWERYRRQILVTLALLGVWGAFVLGSPGAFLDGRIYNSFLSTIPVTLILTLGMTLLVVEQDVVTALELSSHAYVMDMGRVVKQGPSAELLRDPAIREAYLGTTVT